MILILGFVLIALSLLGNDYRVRYDLLAGIGFMLVIAGACVLFLPGGV